jgi:sugar phosphate isomerase/epimerase
MIASAPTITYESLRNIPLSYATCSIGSSNADTLPRKLEVISKAGFTGIELSFPDIIDYGSRTLGHQVASENFAEIISVAGEIRKLCDANNLKVMMLQPFANFEGWPRGSLERQDAFTRVNGWTEIMNVVGTDLLQVRRSSPPISSTATM